MLSFVERWLSLQSVLCCVCYIIYLWMCRFHAFWPPAMHVRVLGAQLGVHSGSHLSSRASLSAGAPAKLSCFMPCARESVKCTQIYQCGRLHPPVPDAAHNTVKCNLRSSCLHHHCCKFRLWSSAGLQPVWQVLAVVQVFGIKSLQHSQTCSVVNTTCRQQPREWNFHELSLV